MPKEFLTASTAVEVTASLDMSAEVAGEGLCPDCKTPMETASLDGESDVLVCMPCRIALPIKD